MPPNRSRRSRGRLPFVDALRGLAAVAVAWFHFTHGNTGFLPEGTLKASGSYGWCGIQIFFVISGFILPWSLNRAGYTLRAYGKFLARRIVRIDPPYYAAIALTLMLGYLSSVVPGYKGESFHLVWPQVLGHVGFLNAFTGYPWLNPAFWTLAIEFQYYLLLGLLMPLLVSSGMRVWSLIAVAFLLAPAAVHSDRLMPHYACLFLLGIITFQYRSGLIGWFVYMSTALAAGADLWFLGNAATAIAGTLTALAIAFVGLELKPLSWLGTLSYSLYLLHVPVGGRVVNAGMRLPHTAPVQCLVLTAAMGLSLASAYIFYILIEKPACRWAAEIGFSAKLQKR